MNQEEIDKLMETLEKISDCIINLNIRLTILEDIIVKEAEN